jgi:hypothetical protein
MTHNFTVGMEVLIDKNRFGSNRPMQLCVVEKVTATQFTAGGIRFKPYGDFAQRIGGDKWDLVICKIATDEMKRGNEITIKRRNAENALSGIAKMLDRLRDDEAVKALDLLPQAIAAMETPKANATVKRMANAARDALK